MKRKRKFFCDLWDDKDRKKAIAILATVSVLILGVTFVTAFAVTTGSTDEISVAAIMNGLVATIITAWIISFGGTLWLCFSRNRKKKNQKGSN